MDIAEIEKAVDRIIAKRSQQHEEQPVEKSRKQLLQNEEYVCPKYEEHQKVHHASRQPSKTTKVDVICTGRHAEFIDSLVASKKKAM